MAKFDEEVYWAERFRAVKGKPRPTAQPLSTTQERALAYLVEAHTRHELLYRERIETPTVDSLARRGLIKRV